MKRAAFALLLTIPFVACDPGPLPTLNYRQETQKRDAFPTSGEAPHPLDIAIHSGDLDAARRLLEQGANPNLRWSQHGDRFPLQAVLEAPSYGYRIKDPIEAVRLLISHGADPNSRWCPYESRGPSYVGSRSCTAATAITPLMFAASLGNRDIAQTLLDAGADPSPRDWGEASALDYAWDEVIFEMISRVQFPDISTRDKDALEWISNYDGGPYATGPWSYMPLTRAMSSTNGVYMLVPPRPAGTERRTLGDWDGSARVLGRLNILLRLGVDPNQRLNVNDVDWPALGMALSNLNHRAAAVLLRNGADVSLRWCAIVDYVQIENKLRMRVSKDSICTHSSGMTPLMLAASKGDRDSIRLLLEFGADRSLRDWEGRNALDYAIDPEVRKLLVK